MTVLNLDRHNTIQFTLLLYIQKFSKSMCEFNKKIKQLKNHINVILKISFLT